MYYTWRNEKKSNNSNWFKILAPTWNGKCDLSDELYSVSDIQDYFECIFKKYWQTADNPLIRIEVQKILEQKIELPLRISQDIIPNV